MKFERLFVCIILYINININNINLYDILLVIRSFFNILYIIQFYLFIYLYLFTFSTYLFPSNFRPSSATSAL